MSKISLIIKREYTTRVLKKSFIILTLLTPMLLAGIIMLPLWMSGIKDNTKKQIIILDKTHKYASAFKSSEIYSFDVANQPESEIRTFMTGNKNVEALLVIAADLSVDPKAATLYAEQQVSIELKNHVSHILKAEVEKQKLAAYNIPHLKEMVEQSRANIDISTVKWGKNGNDKIGSSELALAIGTVSAMLIYIFIIAYGAQVMNGVAQEKTSRVVEIIISSVKPFELMMGKIIGIALVGLTQFGLWILLTLLIYSGLDIISGAHALQPSIVTNLRMIFTMLQGYDMALIVSLFVVYFLGGYLLYASLYAAVGSAVDSETDKQQFALPLTLPIVFGVYAAIYGAQNPDGPLAFWCSIIPLTSPIVMMVRLPFGVPAWQIVLSLSTLIVSFVATTWIAAKIYRTGILMYGKKISWNEMLKWIKY